MRMTKEERQCDVCHKSFKPMTPAQWEINKFMHDRFSIRHEDYLKLKQSSGV
jgi:hypothetical protein